MARYDARNPGALAKRLTEGVELKRFPDEVMVTARDAAFDLYDELVAQNENYRKIYEAWKRFHADYNQWFSASGLGFISFSASA